MAKNRTISIDDINPQSVPEDMESFILFLPVGQAGATETGRTAGTTTIVGNGTQKDRGIEFDYPKKVAAAAP
jgi:hypothetical protein